MCGIAGILHLDGSPVRPDLPRRMVRQVRHRGPDALDALTDGPVGLAHVRLSIIDLAGGAQPMRSRSGRLSLVFNGEVFNYLELRAELEAAGHRFRTRSDTEVILHAYQQYGDACVERFNGQWAFALWDRDRRRLLLSRDRLGIRPLFYTCVGGKLLFASEVKALFAHPDAPRELDPRGLDQLLTFWTTLPPRTVFHGVEELPPGCNLAVADGALHTRPYWQIEYPTDPSGFRREPADDLAAELLDLLRDATRLQLRSDVPVGAYLSGGLDSSLTTALIREATSSHLRTFSVTFADAEFDESRYQQQLVAHLGSEHQAAHCAHDDIAAVFPEVVWHTEKPVLRTAPAPLFLLSRLVRDEGFKVVLTGEGADEMFGGYDIFKEAKLRRFCAAAPESAFRAALFGRLYPYQPKFQAQSPAYQQAFFRVRPDELRDPLFSHRPRWELTAQLTRLLSGECRAALAGYDALAEARATLPADFVRWHPFCQAQHLETAMLMPGYILSSQGDRMASGHGVEGRFPFLDHRLAEFAARVPPRLKMRGLREKHLLKRAAGHLVPASIVQRPKQPYRAPDAASFFDAQRASARRDWIEAVLAPAAVRAGGVFDPHAVQRLAEKARAGRIIGVKDNMALVAVLSTQLLIERFIAGGRPAAAGEHDAAAVLPPANRLPSESPLASLP